MPWFLTLVALRVVTGVLLSWLLEGRGLRPWPERLAEAPLLGAMALGSALVLGLVLFDHFAVEVVYAVPAGLAVCVAWRAARSGRGPGSSAASQTEPHATDRPWKPVDAIFPVLALGLTASLMVTAYTGGVAGDYMGIWSFKGMVLREHGALAIPDFQDDTRFHYHKAYPLLFPSLQAVLHRWTGEVADLTAKLLYPLLLCCSALLLYFRMLRRSGPAAAWAGGGLCLSVPFFMSAELGGVSTGYMDIPLGCFILLAHLAAHDWMESGRSGSAVRAGLFLAAAALTKNEGVIAAAVTVTLLAVFTLRAGWSRRGKGLLCVLAPLLLIAGTWYVYRRTLPEGPQDYVGSIFGPTFWKKAQYLPKVVGSALTEGLSIQRWGFLWVLCVLTLPTWFRRDGWVSALYLCGMFVVYVLALTFSPLNVDYQVNSTVDRLMAQMVPLAAAMVAMAMGRARQNDPLRPIEPLE